MKTAVTILMMGLLCFTFTVNAQTKDSVRSKLKSLKGEAKKIIVQTDEGELTFEGDEAEYLLRKMKKESSSSAFSFVPPDEFIADNHFEFKEPDIDLNLPHFRFFRNFDDDMSLIEDYNKKITVDKEDGKTKVTVKYKKDGDMVTETYEGEDAEKFLKEFNEDEPVSLEFKSKDKDKKDTRIIIIK